MRRVGSVLYEKSACRLRSMQARHTLVRKPLPKLAAAMKQAPPVSPDGACRFQGAWGRPDQAAPIILRST